jgi:hypothetical protein
MERESSSKDLKKKIEEKKRREKFELTVLQPMQADGRGFIRSLDNQLFVIDTIYDKLADLEMNGANFKDQLADLRSHRQAILAMKEVANKILEKLRGEEAAHLSDSQVREIKERLIDPLVRAEQARRIRAMRIQGPLVHKKQVTANDCKARHTEAIVHFIECISRATADKNSGLGKLWRWMSRDNDGDSIWLYSHHHTDKWKCMLFRISVETILDDLLFSLETYIPFGFGNDPAQYEMAASNVFIRPNWRVTDVNSMTYNTSNTFNVQTTHTVSHGVSIGENVTDSTGRSISGSTSQTIGTTEGKNSSQSESDGWMNNSTYGYSTGGDLFGSHSSSHSYGSSGGTSRTWGTSSSKNVSNTVSDSESHNIGRSVGVQTNLTDSVAEAVSGGFSCSDGKALQVNCWAYGIDFSKDPEVHLKQWRHGNRDAGHMFDKVQALFDAVCRSAIKHLQGLVMHTGDYEDKDLDSRIDEINRLIPVGENASGHKVALTKSGQAPPLLESTSVKPLQPKLRVQPEHEKEDS